MRHVSSLVYPPNSKKCGAIETRISCDAAILNEHFVLRLKPLHVWEHASPYRMCRYMPHGLSAGTQPEAHAAGTYGAWQRVPCMSHAHCCYCSFNCLAHELKVWAKPVRHCGSSRSIPTSETRPGTYRIIPPRTRVGSQLSRQL